MHLNVGCCPDTHFLDQTDDVLDLLDIFFIPSEDEADARNVFDGDLAL